MASLKEQFAKKKQQKQQQHPKNPEIFNLSVKYYEQGNFQLAIVILTQFIELNPSSAEAYSNRGSCYRELKNYELALADYNKAIKLNPRYSIAYYNRGNFYQELENHELALADCSKAIELNPRDSIAYCCRGNSYHDLKNYELSLTDYNKAIELNPRYAMAYCCRGNSYQELKNYELALADYSKAVELNSRYATAYNNRGHCYYELKNYDLSLADYNKAIELNPSFVIAYDNRGVCYNDLKNYELAFADYNKAIELNPRSFVTYVNRGVGYYELKNYELALADYSEAIKLSNLSENKKQLCFVASNIAVTAKEYSKAEEYIKQAFEQADSKEQQHKAIYLKGIENAKELEDAHKAEKVSHKKLHEKEQEMISFFTHTLRNALASAPESLRQAIRLLGSEDYEKNKKYYKAINKITALFSTLSLTDCLIDTFKQSINDPEEFKLAWQKDNTGDATPKWVIASALRQSLNRIIFMSDASQLEKLLNVTETASIVSTRKSFIETVLPLNIDNQGINTFYDWLNGINTIEISIEETNHSNFGINQVKFSLLFAITSEILLNALKYWNGTGHIQISWQLIEENYIFTVKNPCHANASSNLAGTHKGIAFINRLMELLGDQAQFNCIPEEQLFTAQLKLHKSLLGDNT